MAFNFFFRLKKFSPALVITWVTNPIHPKKRKRIHPQKTRKNSKMVASVTQKSTARKEPRNKAAAGCNCNTENKRTVRPSDVYYPKRVMGSLDFVAVAWICQKETSHTNWQFHESH